MLPRDEPEDDYTMKYWPMISEVGFENDFFHPEGKKLAAVVMNRQELKDLEGKKKFYMGLQMGVFGLSLIPGLFFNKVKAFDRIERRWKRILCRTILFIVPNMMVSTYLQYANTILLLELVKKYEMPYTEWRLNGDVTCFGNHIRLAKS